MARPTIQILAEHAAATLPDAPANRREVLNAILTVLVAGTPAHKNVKAQLAALDLTEKLQSELPLIFKQGSR